MAKPRPQLGRRLLAHRKARGMSALALADAAGLSMNMVRFAERGLRVPRIATLRRIARQLDLSRTESDELVRLAALARAPAADQDALSGPPIPDLVLWKYLPEALYRVDHELLGLAPANPDRLYADISIAAAGLLAWEALIRQAPTGAQRAALIEGIERAARTAPTSMPEPAARVLCAPAAVASAMAPHAWRTLLFGNRRAVLGATRRLRRWSYYVGVAAADRPAASFAFRDAALDARCGVNNVSVHLLKPVFDSLILDLLWRSGGLAEWAGDSPDFDYYVDRDALLPLGHLLRTSPATIRAELLECDQHVEGSPILPLVWLTQQVRALGDIRFLCDRLADHPAVARAFFGENGPALLAGAKPRAAEIGGVLQEEIPKRVKALDLCALGVGASTPGLDLSAHWRNLSDAQRAEAMAATRQQYADDCKAWALGPDTEETIGHKAGLAADWAFRHWPPDRATPDRLSATAAIDVQPPA